MSHRHGYQDLHRADAVPRIGTLDRVVAARGGLVSSVVPISATREAAAYHVCQAMVGDVGAVLPDVAESLHAWGALDGAGTGVDLGRAADLAVVEAVERWSSTVVTADQVLVASADELAALGLRTLDMATVPRCSDEELAHPRCPLRPFDPGARLRWVDGVDLLDGERVLVPAVMTFLGLRQWPSECWWLPISTGCAAHTDLPAAVLGGLLEVVERDALTLTWLHRLPLVELDVDGGTTRVYDATLEHGIPTVYAVDRADGPVATVVGAATAGTAQAAVEKVLREVQSCRIALEAIGPGGEDVDSFVTATDGARFMAAAERTPAFSFLLDPARSERRLRPLRDLEPLCGANPTEQLRAAIAALCRSGAHPVAVELTTREARVAGLRVVRVIVPELVPLSFSLRARYLGHQRAREGGWTARYPASRVFNPVPQPMA